MLHISVVTHRFTATTASVTCVWIKVIGNKWNVWIPKYWPDLLFIQLCKRTCFSVDARGGREHLDALEWNQFTEQSFFCQKKTLPLSHCPQPITSVWDWALLSKDIAQTYTYLLIPSLEQALFNCILRQSLVAVRSENSWKNHDESGFDPNVYITCQIFIHETRNSAEFPLCDAILRLHRAARRGSEKSRIQGRENPSARIF